MVVCFCQDVSDNAYMHVYIQLYIFVLGQLKIIQVAFGSETSLFSLSNTEPGKFCNFPTGF